MRNPYPYAAQAADQKNQSFITDDVPIRKKKTNSGGFLALKKSQHNDFGDSHHN